MSRVRTKDACSVLRGLGGGNVSWLPGTLSWLGKYRRLTIRYERRADIHEAFLHLGCALICLAHL